MVIDLEKLQKDNKKLKSKKEGKKQKDFLKKFTTKLSAKKIVKSNQMEVHIPKRERTSILNDPNRFFTHELEETKKSLYFS